MTRGNNRNVVFKSADDYQYSSYRYYAKGALNKMITPDFIYEGMGHNSIERQRRYQKIIIERIIKDSYNKGAWGSNYQRYKEGEKIDRRTKREISR